MLNEKQKGGLWVGILLLFLTLTGGYLRLNELNRQSFWVDEAFSAVHAKAILQHGIPLLSTTHVSWTYFPAHYLMAFGYGITGQLQAGTRLPSALAGTVLIPIFFWFNRRATGSLIQALVATFILTFLTYEIAWSRQARGYVLLQLCGVLALGCLLQYRQERTRPMLWVGVLGALGCPFIHPAGLLYLLIAGLFLLPVCKKVVEVNNRLTWACAAGLSFLVLALSYRILGRVMDSFIGYEHSTYWQDYLRFFFGIFGPALLWIMPGAVWALGKERAALAPLLLATLAYLLLICFQTSLFHYRYVLPVLPFLITLITVGGAGTVARLWTVNHRWSRMLTGAMVLLFAGSLMCVKMNLRPQRQYVLGHTEPQADWATAYRWLEKDAARRGWAPGQIPTISTFPVFHELYLGAGGAKYYLPLTLTGRSNEVWTSASYVQAQTVDTLEAYSQLEGYAVLDHMGFEMMLSQSIRSELARLQPAVVIPGPEEVVIWRLVARHPQRTLMQALQAGKKQTVVLYGTSLTAHGAWVTQVESALNQVFPGQITWINSAIPGLWSGPALDRMTEQVLCHNPDAVFLEFSINDAFSDSRTSVDEARYNLNEMINRILERNSRCEIVLMVMNPPWGRPQAERPHYEDYADMYRTVARLRGCLLIDSSVTWRKVLTESDCLAVELLPDGLHPSAKGDSLVTTPEIIRAMRIE
jgi:acyl-CoA thioesterase-1